MMISVTHPAPRRIRRPSHGEHLTGSYTARAAAVLVLALTVLSAVSAETGGAGLSPSISSVLAFFH